MRRDKVTPSKLQVAKDLRRNMTPAETVLWALLRTNQLDGYHFRRQEVVAGWIVDYYCHRARLCVEVDGSVHEGIVESDEERDRILTGLGFQMLRITNEQVLQNPEAVLELIRHHLIRKGSARA